STFFREGSASHGAATADKTGASTTSETQNTIKWRRSFTQIFPLTGVREARRIARRMAEKWGGSVAKSARTFQGDFPRKTSLIHVRLPHGQPHRLRLSPLRHQFLHHLAMHVGQPEIAPGVTVGELFVIKTEQSQDSGV